MVDSNNLAGHRRFYEKLKATLPPDQFEAEYVGGGDLLVTGHREAELIKHFVNLDGATLVDIGCCRKWKRPSMSRRSVVGYRATFRSLPWWKPQLA